MPEAFVAARNILTLLMLVCLRSGCCLSNCTIKQGAACVSGLCCKNCQLHRQGKICRESIGECDLPEYCNGTSSWCPEDVFKQDGTPCGDKDCCFQGKCHNHERQCKAVFGKAAHLAPLSCFKAVNTEGDRCGNCGGDGLTYNKCEEKDVLCGRLQCVNVKKIPQMKSLGSIVQTPVDDILCWGTEFHAGRDMVDVGSVRDGTPCGDNKICINRTCVNIKILDYDCNYTKCSNRGLCNSKKNCHCDFGWAPPDCKLKGFGGSVDSGPPPTASMAIILAPPKGYTSLFSHTQP
ncbi:disintegrin and metalloproteinase domain-containing protein 21-like [Chrysemys picta bellii]|uniref:disintegrin and metalloproteinase domain-containing protein 21-like n=1 Tax=Chrysemys picta bellii TaxID=8478 RepID=UPI0032B0FA75